MQFYTCKAVTKQIYRLTNKAINKDQEIKEMMTKVAISNLVKVLYSKVRVLGIPEG